MPERFIGHLVETRGVHWHWDPMGRNRKDARVGFFYIHAGTTEWSDIYLQLHSLILNNCLVRVMVV